MSPLLLDFLGALTKPHFLAGVELESVSVPGFEHRTDLGGFSTLDCRCWSRDHSWGVAGMHSCIVPPPP